MGKSKVTNREQWLQAAAGPLLEIIKQQGGKAVDKPLLSFGFPSVRALSNSGKRIGECWPIKATATGQSTILISPLLDSPIEILATLLHELIHASIGTEHGHRKPFSQMARKCGLEGKPTATHAGSELEKQLGSIAKDLGPLPHAALQPTARLAKKQTTRMRLYQCNQCGQKIRAATDTLYAAHMDGPDGDEECGRFELQP